MTQSFRGEYTVTTALILLISIVSSVLGITRRGHYNDSAELLARLYAQDVVILVVAVPALAIGLWYASQGSLRGHFVWLGSLAFMTYMWASYAFTVAYNSFFLGYVVLFSLSLFTLLGGSLTLDSEHFYRRLNGRLSHRVYSGFLGVAAIGLAALWLSELIPAAIAGTLPAAVQEFGPQATDTYVIDLGIVVPSLAITARLLWNQEPWGYTLAGILLMFTALLAPAITAITVVDFQEGVTMSLPVVLGSVVPPLIGAAFAGKYLYSVGGSQRSS